MSQIKNLFENISYYLLFMKMIFVMYIKDRNAYDIYENPKQRQNRHDIFSK